MRQEILAVVIALLIVGSLGVGYFLGSQVNVRTTTSTSSVSTTTTSMPTNTTFVEPFYYPISINYTGSWNLVYWGQNGTYGTHDGTHESTISVGGDTVGYNFKRSLNGSGNWQATITTYAVGYEQETLCAKATKLDPQGTLTLAIGGPPYHTYEIGGFSTINSTTTSDPSAEVCYIIAV